MSCECCRRRDFIYELLSAVAVTGTAGAFAHDLEAFLAAGPKPVPAGAIPDKTGAVKVRLVFSIWEGVQATKTWPHVGFDFRPVMKNIVDTLNAAVKGVEFIPCMAQDEKTAKPFLKEDARRGDIAGYLVLQMNNWPRALQAFATTKKPLLFCAYPYSGNGGFNVYNAAMIRRGRPDYAFMGSLDFNDTVGAARAFEQLKNGTAADFVKAATDYRLAHTPKESGIKPCEGPLDCLSPEETLAALKGKKILSVPGHSVRGYIKPGNARAERARIEKDFGIVIEDVSFEEVDAAMKAVPDDVARKQVAEWKRTARKIAKDVTDASLLGAAKLYCGMRDILKKHEAQAITVACLPGFYNGKLAAYPCLGFMELQDAGLLGTCENDIRSTVAMMVFGAMTKGRIGFISDPVIDSSRRAMVFTHCVSTRKFLGVDGPTSTYDIRTHCADRGGPSNGALAPVNYPVTTVQFHYDSAVKKGSILVQTGRTIGNDPDERACRTKIAVEVTGDFELSYRHWDKWRWHRVTFLGDFRKDVEALAKKLGYSVVYES